MKVGVVTFPGANCDYDAYAAIKHVLGEEATFLWHQSHDLEDCDMVVLPGGFTYGDYLRAGAIAQFSPIMKQVIGFARSGGLVMGICNGFQVLCESGLLPGALMRNRQLRFSCKFVHLRTEQTRTPYTQGMNEGEIIRIPIAHGDGNYYHFDDDIRRLEDNGQVVFRYVDADGRVTQEANPNGSIGNIAGICNEEGNVLGMMPHPERAVERVLGSDDGLRLFVSIRNALTTMSPAEKA